VSWPIKAECRKFALQVSHPPRVILANSLDYLRQLSQPTLWRGEVQLISGADHAPHQEPPGQLTAALLTEFVDDLS
jgi:pimeloyl-ACP methyl ester carboxylesterase